MPKHSLASPQNYNPSTSNLLSGKNKKAQKTNHILRENLVEFNTDYSKFDLLMQSEPKEENNFVEAQLKQMDSI